MSHVKNSNIAKILFEIADLLELKGVQFKPRAYRRAAQNISSLSDSIEEYYENEKIDDISGVGDSIASKVREILETGKLEYLEELRKEFPEGLQKLMNIQGLGPKRLMKLHEELNIKELEDLEEAAKNEKIKDIEGFGKRSEENIIKGVKMYKEAKTRFLLGEILPIANDIESRLKELDAVQKIEIAGSIRRKKETIGDLDVLVISDNPEDVMNFFVELEEIKRVLSKGKTRSTIIIENNLQVDLRIVEEDSFGSALQYFTGSKEHNVQLRRIALDKDWKLSEYGLRDKKKNEKIAGKTEKEIYELLGLVYIEPELREENGEIEAARNNDLPNLIELGDIKGDLHVHTNWSEGNHSIRQMAEKAMEFNYEYMAICDHSKTLKIAQGMDEDKFRKQMKKIERIDEELDDIEILKGAEVNIDADGKLDLDNSLLKDLDIVVASIHSGFSKSQNELTERLINAMHNDHVSIIGHPTGRIIQKRKPMDLDLTKIFEEAMELGIIMELNSYPTRLDLSDINCRKVKSSKVKIAIDTDAHNKDEMRYMELGVGIARRGWIEKKEVINTLSIDELRKLLK